MLSLKDCRYTASARFRCHRSISTRNIRNTSNTTHCRRLGANRARWLIAVVAGVLGTGASLAFAFPSVHLDGREGHRHERSGRASLGTDATSHFSYSYYESSESGHSDSVNHRSSYLRQRSHLPGTHTGIHRYDTAQIARWVPLIVIDGKMLPDAYLQATMRRKATTPKLCCLTQPATGAYLLCWTGETATQPVDGSVTT